MRRSPLAGPRRWDTIRSKLLGLWAGLALLYLFLPIFIVVLFSFNNPNGRFNLTWKGFTLKHWEHPFSVPGLGAAMGKSLEIAIISTSIALVARHVHGARAGALPVPRPQDDRHVRVPAARDARRSCSARRCSACSSRWASTTGFVTIVIAHMMFNVSYVVVTVKARLEGMDLHIEEAAMDLGANEWTTFRKITLPLIAPGVAAAGLLAFALSIDDFVITNFTAGQTVTFPLFIYGATKQGIPPEVNVLATFLLIAALALMALNLAWQKRKAAVDARVPVPAG